jgi:hypothetical protein
MTDCIYKSRAKDYESEYRKMVFDSVKEMEKVIGRLKDNSFITQQQQELKIFRQLAASIEKRFETTSKTKKTAAAKAAKRSR